MRRAAFGVVVTVLLAGCSGDDAADPPDGGDDVSVNDALCLDGDAAERPVVELIDAAIEQVERLSDTPPEFFEISADRQRVSLIVATPQGEAAQFLFCGARGYVPAESLGPATGSTFTADAVDLDADTIFDQIDAELPDPDIVDFAIVGRADGGVVYDATVQSDAGGVLAVLLSGSGEVLGVDAR